MDLIYSSVKSLILNLSQRGHVQQNSCLFPILIHGSLWDLGVVAVSRATAWSLYLTVESSSKGITNAVHSQQIAATHSRPDTITYILCEILLHQKVACQGITWVLNWQHFLFIFLYVDRRFPTISKLKGSQTKFKIDFFFQIYLTILFSRLRFQNYCQLSGNSPEGLVL